jgi:hypothetical protein
MVVKQSVYRLIKRYTYAVEMAYGFPSYASADAFNRKHFIKDPEFGTECWVEEYVGEVCRNEDGTPLTAPVEFY